MLRIAICDDDQIACTQIEDYLYKIENEIHDKIDLDVFTTGEELKEFLTKGIRYDVVLLDIELNTMCGIDIGDLIRNSLKDENTIIIYISKKETYAMSLFKTRPFDFIVKPVAFEDIKHLMIIIYDLLNREDKFLSFKVGGDTYRIQVKDIYYLKSYGKKITIVTAKEEIEFYGKLIEIYEKLKENDFIYIHKSYLVNYNSVSKFEYDNVTIVNGHILPISQSNRSLVKKELIKRKKEKYERARIL